MELIVVNVGYRPRTEDRCPVCGKIDAHATVTRGAHNPVRMGLGSPTPAAYDYDLALKCRADGAVWRVTWNFGADQPQFYAVDK